ncbi:hypothetical protein BR93DRAFT_541589 [Coniochaeta sp. PMI_546]|nr:hypothetical protein BR93DRAFT_541589 [Coniochaeta sp. PMI_546]
MLPLPRRSWSERVSGVSENAITNRLPRQLDCLCCPQPSDSRLTSCFPPVHFTSGLICYSASSRPFSIFTPLIASHKARAEVPWNHLLSTSTVAIRGKCLLLPTLRYLTLPSSQARPWGSLPDNISALPLLLAFPTRLPLLKPVTCTCLRGPSFGLFSKVGAQSCPKVLCPGLFPWQQRPSHKHKLYLGRPPTYYT